MSVINGAILGFLVYGLILGVVVAVNYLLEWNQRRWH